jgi:hypothetical protein
MTKPKISGDKQANAGQWRPGESGNPTGKPKGALNRSTRAVLDLLDGEAEALTRRAVELALEGDTTALRLCLERLAPPIKDRPVTVPLPPMAGAEDASKAMAAVVAAMASGNITPGEAAAVAGVVESFRRVLEVEELERRLAALEQKGS